MLVRVVGCVHVCMCACVCEVEGMKGYDLSPSDLFVNANEDNCFAAPTHT